MFLYIFSQPKSLYAVVKPLIAAFRPVSNGALEILGPITMIALPPSPSVSLRRNIRIWTALRYMKIKPSEEF